MHFYASKRGILLQQQVDGIEFSTRAQDARRSGQRIQHSTQALPSRCLWHDAIDTRRMDELGNASAKSFLFGQPSIPCIAEPCLPQRSCVAEVLRDLVTSTPYRVVGVVDAITGRPAGKQRRN